MERLPLCVLPMVVSIVEDITDEDLGVECLQRLIGSGHPWVQVLVKCPVTDDP